eukprot:SAG22_NODE_4941_length_1125_cov_0.838207_1_plen_147_part_10
MAARLPAAVLVFLALLVTGAPLSGVSTGGPPSGGGGVPGSPSSASLPFEKAGQGELDVPLAEQRRLIVLSELDRVGGEQQQPPALLQTAYRAGHGAPGWGGIANYSCYMNPAAITLQTPPCAGHVLLFVEARWPACDDFRCRESVCG